MENGKERRLAIAIGALALFGPVLFVRLALRGSSFEISDAEQVTAKLIFGLVVFAITIAGLFGARRFGARRAENLLVLAASLSVAAWFNVGFLHGNRAIHLWEHFHYFLGSRYYAELGYEGLYAASLGDQADHAPDNLIPIFTRDLRDNQVVRTTQLLDHMREVYTRFTPERWESFSRDHAYFLGVEDSFRYLEGVRKDHGYNASPTWTFFAQCAGRWFPLSERWLTALALLDLALMTGMFWAVFASFGLRTGCLSLCVFGWSYVAGYDDLGGSFLRFDWLAAVGFALCLLKRERHAGAGALIGLATALRVFPVLFLLGPAVLALRALLQGRWPRWLLPLGAGFTAALALCVVLGSFAGRGFAAWPEFGREIRSHSKLWLTNNLGVENLVLYDATVVRHRLVDLTMPEPWLKPQRYIAARRSELHLAIAALRAAFLLLLVAAVWRATLVEAAVASMAAIFVLTSASAYYWVMLLLLPISTSPALTLALIALNLGTRVFHVSQPSSELNFGVYSWGMGVLFVAWLGPAALATLRGAIARGRGSDADSALPEASSS